MIELSRLLKYDMNLLICLYVHTQLCGEYVKYCQCSQVV